MVVRLSSYLERLEEEEAAKPKERRREVPSVAQLAADVGVHQSTLSRIATGVTRKVDLDLLGNVLGRLRRLGFPATVSDILEYQDEPLPEEVTVT